MIRNLAKSQMASVSMPDPTFTAKVQQIRELDDHDLYCGLAGNVRVKAIPPVVFYNMYALLNAISQHGQADPSDIKNGHSEMGYIMLEWRRRYLIWCRIYPNGEFWVTVFGHDHSMVAQNFRVGPEGMNTFEQVAKYIWDAFSEFPSKV